MPREKHELSHMANDAPAATFAFEVRIVFGDNLAIHFLFVDKGNFVLFPT
ncbi:hypothetical protein [Nostoc sp.]